MSANDVENHLRKAGIYLTNKGLPWGAVCQEMGAGKHRAAAIRFSKPLRRNNIVIPAASFHSSFVASQALQLLYRWHQVKTNVGLQVWGQLIKE
ncbi:MAG TPA: hypothetical protein PKM63_20145 [Panacibacter sp.]|nr:hypothetical protein [Panacibacter sp.]